MTDFKSYNARCTTGMAKGERLVVVTPARKRYVFTRETREQPIDECDVEQFRGITMKKSTCKCAGGTGGITTVQVFEITEV